MHLSAMDFAFPETNTLNPAVIGMGAARVLDFKLSLDRKTLNIDREARTIDNVILAQVGEAKGHDVEIEQSFIDDMARYVSKKLDDRVQCNYGHQYNALGFQLGAFSNLRKADSKFVGKLSVYKAADKSPEMSGMADWFFDLAEEDPKAVMCSIKFIPKHYYQYDEKGQKVIIQYSWWSGPMKAFEKKPAYVAFDRLISCDIVDNGALTESLFSSKDDGGGMMFYQMVNAPGFKDFLRDHHEHMPQLTEFYQEKFKFSIGKMLSNFFSSKSQDNHTPMKEEEKTPAAASTTPATPIASDQIDAMNAEITKQVELAMKPLNEKIAGLEGQLAAKDTEIAELKKKPAASTTAVKDENPANVTGATTGRSWENNPINLKVKKIHDQQQATAKQA